MSKRELMESLAGEYPVCEFAFGDTSEITFSDKVFTICENECQRYGHSWACPPNAGTIEENIARIRSYSNYFVFSTVWEAERSWDLEACLELKKEHENITRAIRERILTELDIPLESHDENPRPEVYFLSSGCAICDKCACPDEPCRHPKDRLMTMESHGVTIMELLDNKGLTYFYDDKSVVYFTMILFDE